MKWGSQGWAAIRPTRNTSGAMRFAYCTLREKHQREGLKGPGSSNLPTLHSSWSRQRQRTLSLNDGHLEENMRGLEAEKKVFVAHFDILGMSSVLRKSNERAWLLLCDLADASEEEELPLTQESRESITEKFFSDTIILCSSGDDIASLHAILVRSFELFRCAFRVGIPMRAGIAHGSWIEAEAGKQDLFTGDALLRAHHIGESQQLISIAICDVTRERFLKTPFEFKSGLPVIKDYPIPVKGGGCQNRAVLNWPDFCQNELLNLKPLTAQTLADYFSEFGRYETFGENERVKHENTVAFIQWLHAGSAANTNAAR